MRGVFRHRCSHGCQALMIHGPTNVSLGLATDFSGGGTNAVFYEARRNCKREYRWATSAFFTASASALREPTSTTSFFPRVTAV